MQAKFTVQRHFWLTPDQDTELREAARVAGLKESEFLRQAIKYMAEEDR